MRLSRRRFKARARPKGQARAHALRSGQCGTRVAAGFA
jgi:hypothetical protein